MTKYLLDTDHVTLHERGNIPLLHRLEKIAPTDVAVSAVTVEESLRGRLAILSRRLEGAARIHAYDKFIESVRFFGKIEALRFDSACEDHFRLLRSFQPRVDTQD
jgi:tRNA(fMet)-specific endonuclease VapC